MSNPFKIVFIALLLLVSSCDYFHLKKNTVADEVVASVGDKKLYKKDLSKLFTSQTSKNDSLIIRNNFIENWSKKQIILQKAALNLTTKEEEELNKMVNEYREDLFINSYKEALVAQNIDTLVADHTISEFYTANQNIFRLNEELVQYRSLSFASSGSVDAKVTKKLISNNTVENTNQLLENELQYNSLQLNDSVWVTYTHFLELYPSLKNKKKSELLRKNNFIVVKDSVNTHYFYLKTFLGRNTIAPLPYVTPVIKQMILHQKKLKYIKEIEDKLIQEAIQQGTYKKY